jgi:ataxin-3
LRLTPHRFEMIYHERQISQLCGVHALNTLLQGPFFSASDLGAIAQELDAEERSLLGGTAGTSSENVAEDGNFSIQVLSRALSVFDLTAVSLSHPNEGACRENPASELGFIANLELHWFSLRKVNSTWWNLNSMASSPRKIGEFYLSAFLDQLKAEGYSIFVVRDLDSMSLPDMSGQTGEFGKWWTEESALAASAEADAIKASGRAQLAMNSALNRASQGETLIADRNDGPIDMTGDEDFQTAIAASLAEHRRANGGVDTEAELNAAIAASLKDIDDNDASIEVAIAASLQEEQPTSKRRVVATLVPEPDVDAENVVTLAFRLPNGVRMTRRFLKSARVREIEDYLLLEVLEAQFDPDASVVATSFPPRLFCDPNQTIQDAGIADRELLTIQPRSS